MAKKRKIPIKVNPIHKQKPDLFGGMYQTMTKEMKSEKFMSDLQENGFIEAHKHYFSNYINADFGVALSHVKRAYDKYVLDGKWDSTKFTVVLEEIIKKRLVMTTSRFIDYGQQYDQGLLQSSSWLGGTTANQKQATTEDDDLLAYIRKELGRE